MPFDPAILLNVLKSKWLYIGLLLALLGIQTARMHDAHMEAAKYKLAAQTLTKSYQTAQATAQANAIAQKLATEARYRAQAEKTDHDYQTALASAQSAATAYAERMRVHPQGATSNPTPTANDHGATVSPNPAPSAILVSQDDFDICTENSVKIKQAWQWANGLQVDR